VLFRSPLKLTMQYSWMFLNLGGSLDDLNYTLKHCYYNDPKDPVISVASDFEDTRYTLRVNDTAWFTISRNNCKDLQEVSTIDPKVILTSASGKF
jgi:hypothetical protein